MEQPNGSASSHPEEHDDDPARPKDKDVENNDAEPPISPPYWQRGNSTLSEASASAQQTRNKQNRLSGPISLHDNSDETENDQARACWAKAARIDDYVIVSGSVSKAGLGSYVVWNCTIETLNVSRYSTLLVGLITCLVAQLHTYMQAACLGSVELTDA